MITYLESSQKIQERMAKPKLQHEQDLTGQLHPDEHGCTDEHPDLYSGRCGHPLNFVPINMSMGKGCFFQRGHDKFEEMGKIVDVSSLYNAAFKPQQSQHFL